MILKGSSTMERKIDEQNLVAALQIMTTEYFNLQSARSIAVSESVGRSTLFLSTLSTSLVALAFVAQLSHMGTAFFVFALIIFTFLFYHELVTFQRALQIIVELHFTVLSMNRVRRLFVEIAPQIQEYFPLSPSSFYAEAARNKTIRMLWWQVYLTTPGMIGVISSL